MLAELVAATALAAPPALPPRIVAGRSVEGRRIVAVRRGRPDAPVRVLVSGSTHGTEPAGHAVIRRLRQLVPPAGVQVWTVRSFNPDGAVRGTRQNARGVDLNRNFPFRWRAAGRPFDTYHPGPRPASEPETRAQMRLIRRVRPQLSIHFHQALRLVTLGGGARPELARLYGQRTGLPARRLPAYRGTSTSWQNHTFAGSTAFVVELSAGALTPRRVQRHARAVLGVAASLVPRGGATAAAPRPPIRWSPIPFGADRRRQMRAYSRRHYGIDRARLRDPKAIVEHHTASSTFAPAFETFAANRPDVELHELPGVCAHFIVDRDGTIHQLVRLKWMCRHTIGLNHVSFGIEHVGVSDADVMARRRQLAASLRLTRWLQARHGIVRSDVIGHAESLRSPYHYERIPALRGRTHADFAPATMRRYRARL
jgi:N-acetylmuramoyl-L-alanine amidase/Zinc carboxypeptidase